MRWTIRRRQRRDWRCWFALLPTKAWTRDGRVWIWLEWYHVRSIASGFGELWPWRYERRVIDETVVDHEWPWPWTPPSGRYDAI